MYVEMRPTILNLVQRFHRNALLLCQLPRMVCESFEIRLALAKESADGARRCSTALA